MLFTSIFVATLSLASQAIAAPAAAAERFTLGLDDGSGLVSILGPERGERYLVFQKGKGSEAYLSQNTGNYHTLFFDLGGKKPWQAVLPDPGDGDGFVFSVDIIHNYTATPRSWGVGDNDQLFAKLHAARNQFLACNQTINGVTARHFSFGNDYLNGSLPIGCSSVQVFKQGA